MALALASNRRLEQVLVELILTDYLEFLVDYEITYSR